jgi:hypothetical protein
VLYRTNLCTFDISLWTRVSREQPTLFSELREFHGYWEVICFPALGLFRKVLVEWKRGGGGDEDEG